MEALLEEEDEHEYEKEKKKKDTSGDQAHGEEEEKEGITTQTLICPPSARCQRRKKHSHNQGSSCNAKQKTIPWEFLQGQWIRGEQGTFFREDEARCANCDEGTRHHNNARRKPGVTQFCFHNQHFPENGSDDADSVEENHAL